MSGAFIPPAPPALSRHRRSGGRAGWRGVLEALAVALGDAAPPVAAAALEAVEPIVESLYR